MNEIDDTTFKTQLQQREKKNDKKKDIRDIIVMFADVGMDTLGKLIQSDKTFSSIEHVLTEMNELRLYFNKSMIPVSKRYNCVVPHISNNLNWVTLK